MWPVVLAVQKRWRALVGFSVVAAAIVAASIAMVGVDGIRDYLAVLANPDLTSPHIPEEVGIGGLMANMKLFSLPVQLALGAAVAAVTLYSVLRSRIEWVFVIIPAASLAVTPHAIYYDPTLLPLWIVVESIPHALILRWISITLAGPWVFIAFLFRTPWSAISSIGVLTFLFRRDMDGEARAEGMTDGRRNRLQSGAGCDRAVVEIAAGGVANPAQDAILPYEDEAGSSWVAKR